MKILIIHATAGAGHKKAAEAIHDGLQRHTTHQVTSIDCLDYTNPFFKKSYPAAYVFMVTKAPALWGFFFGLVGLPFMQPLVRLVRRCYHKINAGALENFIRKEQFDVIITTHFMSAEVSGYLKRTHQIKSKIICCVTDFDVHPIWINRGVDVYTGACDFTREKIISLGVPSHRVFVTGIPTDEKFSELVDRKVMREKLKINKEGFTVLLATGSFGMGPLEELIDSLAGYQLLVVCGHNKALYERLKSRNDDRVHIYGLVHNMHELMSAADVMITKPGGLSIAEALVKKLPMIFFSAIPGQETGNINVLKKYEAAEDQSNGIMDIINRLDDLSTHPQTFENLQKKLGILSKPNAVKDIISLVTK